MAKKQPKRQFDWRTYSRPTRLLSPAQEESFSAGLLRPLLQMALGDPLYRFEVRSKMATIYCLGFNVCRISGEGPFSAELDDPSGSGPAVRLEIAGEDDVSALLSRVIEAKSQVASRRDAAAPSEREYLQAIATANSFGDLFERDFLVADLEYTYGQRRYDLVALKRTTGVTGPGGFANPRLCFIDVRVQDQRLEGQAGLAAVADDFADFVKALGSSHVERARNEFFDLTRQKVRMGLLEPVSELRGIDERMPEYLVLFADYPSIKEAHHDAALVALHDRLAARHYPTELLRFAVLPEYDGPPSDALVLREADTLTYREFKEYRRS